MFPALIKYEYITLNWNNLIIINNNTESSSVSGAKYLYPIKQTRITSYKENVVRCGTFLFNPSCPDPGEREKIN